MAMHDWTTVVAGIFHHFHQRWIGEIADVLNGGMLPEDYYALSEQQADAPPRVRYTLEAEQEVYAAKANHVAASPGVSDAQPLSLMAYRSDLVPMTYFQPISIGQSLPDVPLFLTPDNYVNVPVEDTYNQAWTSVPRRWRSVIEGGG